MSWLDKMEEKADKLEKSENERVTILQEIRKENANLGREEGRGARIVTTVVGVTVIVWAVTFLFDLVNGLGWTGPTVVLCAMLVGLYWGSFRESRERRDAVSAIVSLVALLIVLVIHVALVFVK